jgi:hypothetical protein
MTLADLEADFYRRCNYNTTADSATQARARAFFNETQAEILAEPGMSALLDGTLTFSSVASQSQYSLPHALQSIKRIRETTNDILLEPRSAQWYYANYPDPSANTGTPEFYVDLGYTGIATQPSAATEIFVDSTSGSDTNTAYVEGYRTGGYFRAESETMTGTTGVSLNAAITDWVLLTRFYLSAAAVGDVTLQTTAAGGTELAKIPIGSTVAKYRSIVLVPTPATAITTYTVDFDWDPQNMSVATDEPILPPRFHRLLVTGARAKEYEKLDDAIRYAAAKQEFERELKKLKHFLFCSPDFKPVIGRGPTRLSRLGAYYPAGT